MAEMEFELTAPPVIFPAMADSVSAFRTAYDLLARRAPKEALDVIEPALAEARTTAQNTYGLRTLRAWAFLQRAQLGPAEAELSALIDIQPDDVWVRHALGRALERQSRYADALPHLKLAAVMSDDYDHAAAVIRVQNLLQRTVG